MLLPSSRQPPLSLYLYNLQSSLDKCRRVAKRTYSDRMLWKTGSPTHWRKHPSQSWPSSVCYVVSTAICTVFTHTHTHTSEGCLLIPSIHFCPLIRGRVVGAAAWARTLRLLSPRTLPPALPGGSQGVPRPAGWHSHSSVSWVFLWVSSRRDMPGTPPKGGVPGASETDAWATLAGFSRCGGAAALLRAPRGWQSSSPYL